MDALHLHMYFDNLVNSKEFEEFTQVLIKLTGLAMALNSPDGISCNKFTGGNRTNKVCWMLRNCKEGRQKCLECDRRHFHQAASQGKPLIYRCYAGFWDMAVPVFVQGRHIATISSGQVLSEPASAQGFQKLCRQLKWWNVSEEKLRKAYESAPYLPKETLQYVMRLLEVFAHQLCESLYHIRKLEERLEKEEIRKAKAYIRKRIREPLLCLTDVAGHVGFSKAHFSHMFKCSTGISYTEFVQNCRIEAAKHYLLHTERSITDICFDCGFNSMTHFNRVFRSLEKMSPRDYRKKETAFNP
ncbi:MAG: PocR ligand-binding domain-containing protein [Victivallales bacterium]|nr:PocR ligand-binding domain-containing protein [Victivallales bacterium]